MKIAISTTTLETKQNQNRMDGIGVYTKSLFNEFISMGHELVPFSFVPKNLAIVGNSLQTSYTKALTKSFLFNKKYNLIEKAQIAHITDYRIIKVSCPIVCTLHDAIPYINPRYSPNDFFNIKKKLMKNLLKNADLYIAISNYSVNELVNFYKINPSKIRVVYNGVSPNWLIQHSGNIKKSILSKYNLRDGYFLTVGTLQPRKNYERIIKAHMLLDRDIRRSFPLVIVGKIGWNCEDIIKLIRSEVNNGFVVWLYDVHSLTELQVLYQNAAAFVFPSLHEGFGLPILEAFASGIPVITSNTTSLTEISSGIAIEVNPLEICEIYFAMHDCILNKNIHSWRIQAGRDRASQLSWSKTALSTLNVYGELM